MKKFSFKESAPSNLLYRCSVAPDTSSIVSILDNATFATKLVSYSSTHSTYVEVPDAAFAKAHNLSQPYQAIYLLVAKLSTDTNAHIIGPSTRIEYVQLSEQAWSSIQSALRDVPQPYYLHVSCESFTRKDGSEGRKVSFVPITSEDDLAEINSNASMVANLNYPEEYIESQWELLDKQTSISADDYLKLEESLNASKQAFIPQIAPTQHTPSIPTSATKGSESQASDFDNGFDFSGDSTDSWEDPFK